jgi:hypothetical protein
MKVEVIFMAELDRKLMAELDRRCPGWREDNDDADDYPVPISEDDLPLSRTWMRRLHITSDKLRQVFAEAREIARDIKPGQTATIYADEDRSGGFLLARVR